MMRTHTDRMLEKETEKVCLSPLVKKTSTESNKTSQSPSFFSAMDRKSGMTDSIVARQFHLRKKPSLSRTGSMFGAYQFCYAEKPGGVGPGFRAIDLNLFFFKALDDIIFDQKLSTNEALSDKAKQQLVDLGEALKIDDLSQKQKIFFTFVTSRVKGPHAIGLIKTEIRWLCDEIKKAVANNDKLNAWMYKFDYAEEQINRITANKDAIREYVGTRLAGIFNERNQNQELVWLNNGAKGAHILLACGWKNGLQELSCFLHGGSEPDFNGVLVVDKDASVKVSRNIPGLGKNLIFNLAVGDGDGMGKEAQNKGFAEGHYFGFDYGKCYKDEGVCSTLQDDFSFEDIYAKVPSFLRSSAFYGIARHFMYRNFNVFYDTLLSERIEGVHLLRKMITGESPKEEVINSYPGLRDEIERIQKLTPSAHDLLKQLIEIRHYKYVQDLLDKYLVQINTKKLAPFDFYFVQMKLDLIAEVVTFSIPYEELEEYMACIDDMARIAAKSNQAILKVFEPRLLLTRQEIDLIDNLEKIFSPVSVMSHDGTVFLNTMRFESNDKRVPFQLKGLGNGAWILSTTNTSILNQLKEDFNLDFVQDVKGLSCTLNKEHLIALMVDADIKYKQKRALLLIKPTYKFVTLPNLIAVINKGQSPGIDLREIWRTDNSLRLEIMFKTEQQARQVNNIYGVSPVNELMIFEIPPDEHQAFQQAVANIYEREQQVKATLVSPETKKNDLSSSFMGF